MQELEMYQEKSIKLDNRVNELTEQSENDKVRSENDTVKNEKQI